MSLFILHQILQFYPYFLGYCGIQYQAYAATSPDSYILDAGITITSVNVSSNGFFNGKVCWHFHNFQSEIFYFKLKIVIEWVANSKPYFTKLFHNYVLDKITFRELQLEELMMVISLYLVVPEHQMYIGIYRVSHLYGDR